MATQVQFRRGSTSQTSTFTGASAEVTVDTDKNTCVVHDGTTTGGFALLRQDGDNISLLMHFCSVNSFTAIIKFETAVLNE